MLTHRHLSSLPLSAAVRQFWCHDRWYEQSDLWIQLTVHRQRHRLCHSPYHTEYDTIGEYVALEDDWYEAVGTVGLNHELNGV